MAYDIQIYPWTLIMQDVHEVIEFKMKLLGTNILSKDEEKEIFTEVYVNGNKSSMDNDFAQATLRGFNEIGIQMKFRDATGRECACLIDISENQVNILKPTYRLGVISKIDIWYGIYIQRVIRLKLEEFFWKFEKRTIGKVPSYPVRFFLIVKNVIVHKK